MQLPSIIYLSMDVFESLIDALSPMSANMPSVQAQFYQHTYTSSVQCCIPWEGASPPLQNSKLCKRSIGWQHGSASDSQMFMYYYD